MHFPVIIFHKLKVSELDCDKEMNCTLCKCQYNSDELALNGSILVVLDPGGSLPVAAEGRLDS